MEPVLSQRHSGRHIQPHSATAVRIIIGGGIVALGYVSTNDQKLEDAMVARASFALDIAGE